MGILNKAVHMQKQMKREFVIDRLHEMGVTHTQEGKSIQECDYEELKYLLVLESFKQIDVEKESGKWF